MNREKIDKVAVFYYSRKYVQDAILKFCQNRETVPRYFEGFGKRPDTLQYPQDIVELAKKGATSFHCSEEIWREPLEISIDMQKEQLNELRTGWDLLIDIDCKWFDYSKKAALAIIQALKSTGVNNIGCKFSVTGDTPVLVKTTEEINLIPISEAIRLLQQEGNIKVLSLDKNKKIVFSNIYDSLEHEEEIYEIYHEQSVLPVRATKHHSVFVWDKGEIMERKVEEIRRGEFLVTYNVRKVNCTLQCADSCEQLSFSEHPENPKQTAPFKVRYTQGFLDSEVNNFSSNEKEIKNTFSLNKNQFGNRQFVNNVAVTPELMRLIGYFLAEGHVTNVINQTGFTLNINEKEYIEDVTTILKNLTGRKISIRHPNSGSTQILIHSKEWATFFDNFCGKKKEKHVPSFSWTLSKELFLEMLKGYIRGDAHKTGEYSITVKSVSKRLITEFVWLCKINGISCTLGQEYNKPHKLPQGTMFKGSLVYILSIPKSELLGEFYRTRNKFSPFPRDKTFPIDGLKQVYRQIKPKMFNSHRPEQMALKKKCCNLRRIQKVLTWFSEFQSVEPNEESRKIISNYNSLFNSDVGTVKIKRIVKKDREKVFDVSVEETEAFFGNYYPILLHNSGGKGFHIIVPWKAFPEEINEVKTKDMFPEWPRIICEYLKILARPILEKEILESGDEYKKLGTEGVKCNSCGNLADKHRKVSYFCPSCLIEESSKQLASSEKKEKKCGQCRKPMILKEERDFFFCSKCNKDSLAIPSNFSQSMDVFGILGLDLVLVSPRHLFRTPYSLHEKTAFSSCVLEESEIAHFSPNDADPLKIKIRDFYPDSFPGEAKNLIVQALEWNGDRTRNLEKTEPARERKFEEIKVDKSSITYPPSIKKILEGMADGRKRALFVLINFFRYLNFTREEVNPKIEEWNKKNDKPLKIGYVKAQLDWAYRNKKMLPPNYDKPYYRDIGIIPEEEEMRAKNPVSYVIRKQYRSKKKRKA